MFSNFSIVNILENKSVFTVLGAPMAECNKLPFRVRLQIECASSFSTVLLSLKMLLSFIFFCFVEAFLVENTLCLCQGANFKAILLQKFFFVNP